MPPRRVYRPRNESAMKTTLLCVLDGVGLSTEARGNAVAAAQKPHFDRLWRDAPHTTLTTHGERVGLPAGQMGNSEVGHLNIGAGRVVRQWLLRISQDLRAGSLKDSKPYATFIDSMRSAGALHLIGLTSDGGVHSHIEHLELLLTEVRRDFAGPIVLHLITDGRDTGPTTGAATIAALERFIATLPHVHIGSVCGRFFAMDRDKRWERTKKAYDCLVGGIGTPCESASLWLQTQYAAGITDEFIEPAIITPSRLSASDGFIFWNFREDRARQIVRALTSTDFTEFDRTTPPTPREHALCFTEYDHSFGLPYLFEAIAINDHLGELVAKAGLAQLRAAETEKYPHVTYFLNGGIEKPYPGEERVLVPSPRDVKTYDLKPEMSAYGITEKVVEGIRSGKYALIVVNLANGDMVGHTGVMEAAVKAVETVDTCLGQMLKALRDVGGNGIIIADHGNAEQMINLVDNTPHTAHTTNPVPCIVVGAPDVKALRGDGALCDVAPTVLELMGLPKSPAMTGNSLLKV